MPLGPDEIILDCSEPEVIKFAGDCYIKVRDVTDEEGFKSDASGSYEDCQECQDDPGGGFHLTNCSSPSDQLVVSATALPGASNGQVYRLTHSGQLKCYEVTATDQVGPYDTIAGPVLESDCGTCESTLPSSEGMSSEQGSSSDDGLVEKWTKCGVSPDFTEPAIIYFDNPSGFDTAKVISTIDNVCYEFANTEAGTQDKNPNEYTEVTSPTAQLTDCEYCSFSNVRFEEITEQVACTPDIVMSIIDWALSNPIPYSDIIDHNGKCYQFKEGTNDAPTVAGAKDSHLSDCDCYTDQTYNVKWMPCAGKQGDGPAYIVRAWAYNPSASITLNGGCYERPGAVVGDANWCAAATCEAETPESIGPWTWEDCDACEPTQGSSGDGGGTGPGGPPIGGSTSSTTGSTIPGDSDGPIGSLSEPLVPESDPSPTTSSAAPSSSEQTAGSENVCLSSTCPTVNGFANPPSVQLTVGNDNHPTPYVGPDIDWGGVVWTAAQINANNGEGTTQCACPSFYTLSANGYPTDTYPQQIWALTGANPGGQALRLAHSIFSNGSIGNIAVAFRTTVMGAARTSFKYHVMPGTSTGSGGAGGRFPGYPVQATTAAQNNTTDFLIRDGQFFSFVQSGLRFTWKKGINW